jgi:hypothetical protein
MDKNNILILIIVFGILYLLIRKDINNYDEKIIINYDDYMIVCAKYNKNTNFLQDIPIQSVVITKDIDVPNKANEASSYLYYIINNYNNLPNNLIFIHDEDESWHHEGYITKNIYKWIYNFEKNGSTYYEFNNKYYNKNDAKKYEHDVYDMFIKYWEYIFETPITNYENTPSTRYLCCAQFIVSKKVIMKRPLEFYKKIYDWLMDNSNENGSKTSGLNDPNSGYYMGMYLEWTWRFIFEL